MQDAHVKSDRQHAPASTDAAALPRRRRKRGRAPVNALAHEGLFLLLTNLRAANADSLYELFFKPKRTPRRTAMRRLKDLVDAGYLGHIRLDGARWVYHLTHKSLALTPALEARSHAALFGAPPDRQAMFCWLRSTFYALLTADGWTVGNDGAALYALRRFLIDTLEYELGEASNQTRAALQRIIAARRASPELRVTQNDLLAGRRWRCDACGEVLRERRAHDTKYEFSCGGSSFRAVPVAPCDIAWRRRGDSMEAMLLVIDNPSLPLERQLDALPLSSSPPRLNVIVRSTDARSHFDRARMKWKRRGARHAELDKAFAPDGRLGRLATVVEYRPEVQAYYAR